MPSRLDSLSPEQVQEIKETAYNLLNSRKIIDRAIPLGGTFLDVAIVERPQVSRNANASEVKDPSIIEAVHQTALRLIGSAKTFEPG